MLHGVDPDVGHEYSVYVRPIMRWFHWLLILKCLDLNQGELASVCQGYRQ